MNNDGTMEDMMEDMDLYYRTLEDRPDIGWFLQGHLVIEHLLKKRLLQHGHSTQRQLKKAGFYNVVHKCSDHGLISDAQMSVLLLVNDKRNNYAHELEYRPSLEEWIELWEKAQAAFCDMTDGIEQGLAELRSIDTLDSADRFHLNELFVQICHDL